MKLPAKAAPLRAVFLDVGDTVMRPNPSWEHLYQVAFSEYGIEVDWDGDRMVFDGSVEKQWNILRLLDEARTLGPVTGKHWETSSKVEV